MLQFASGVARDLEWNEEGIDQELQYMFVCSAECVHLIML